MAMRAFVRGLILVAAFFGGARGELVARAEEGTRRHVLTETHADGAKTLFVIDEDLALRDDPTRLSQRTVFRRRFARAHLADFEAAKARYAADAPVEAKALRLPRKGKPLWVAVKDRWTPADEDAYSAWFARNVRADFLRGTGLNADCADVGLIFRWVYARDNRLPIANSLAGSGKLFGNFTGADAWDKLPTHADWRRDERFKEAMRALFDQTYTWSIHDDQYPVAVAREYVRPGTMYMIIRSSGGHTQTVHAIADGRGFATFWGNEPASEYVADTGLSLEGSNGRGFANWRHVRRTVENGKETWTLVPAAEMPGYSREQFEAGYPIGREWLNWVLAKLGYSFSDEQRYAIFAKTFEQSIDYRRSVVGTGSLYCGPAAPCATTSADYDAYSSFSRDRRLKDLRDEMRALEETLGSDNPEVERARDRLEARGEVAFGAGASYYDALVGDAMERWSADPNVSPLARWGGPAEPSSKEAFLSAADAYLEGLKGREALVQSAWYQCHYWTCSGNEASVKAVETARLDGKFRRAYGELATAAAAPGVDDRTRAKVRALYRGFALKNFTANRCASGGVCNADDVTFGEGAGDRVSRWSAKPKDALGTRWGF